MILIADYRQLYSKEYGRVAPGEVFTVSDRIGQQLLRRGLARRAEPEAEPEAEPPALAALRRAVEADMEKLRREQL